jgi:hypothetical protein
MKSKIFYVIIFMMNLNIADAQNEDEPGKSLPGNWDLSLTAGFTQSINSDIAGPGITYSLDIGIPIREAGMFVNFSYADFNKNFKYQVGNDNYYSRLNFTQLATGIRFYSGNSKSTYVDAGMGLFDNGREKCLSLTASLGGKIALSPVYAITLNGRFNAALYKDPLYYFGLNAGFAVNGSIKPTEQFNKNRFALTTYAGAVGKGLTDHSDGAFSAEISYRMSERVSLLMNYLYSKSHDESTEFSYVVKDEKNTSLAAGAKFYVTKNNIKIFAEGLTGYYTYDYTGRYSGGLNYVNNLSDKYYGFTLGAGAEMQLVNNLSGVIKFDQYILVDGEAYSGLSGGMKYSF